jgi:hypothetical protein
MANGEYCGAAELHARINDVEKLLLKLRDADLEAIKVAQATVGETMKGFPAEYARKNEVDQVRDTVTRLDKESMSAKEYASAHEVLEQQVAAKLSQDAFDATVKEWTVWRGSVDQRIADAIRAAAIVSATTAGEQISWRKLALWLGIGFTVVSFIILLSNNVIQIH